MRIPSSDLTRRQLFQSAGTAAIGTALTVLPGVVSGQQDGVQALIDRAFAARDKGDFATMESLLHQAVDAGRTNEWVLRGLAFALSKQWKFAEAIRVALDNNRRNPGAWSVAGVCETYGNTGNYEEARKWLKYAKENESQWGDARAIMESALEQIAVKTYRLEYTLDPATLATHAEFRHLGGDFLCPTPLTRLPYQTATYEVSDAKAVKEEIRNESLLLRVTPNGLRKARAVFTVTLTPMNVKTKLRTFTLDEIPEKVRSMSKSTTDVDVEHTVVRDRAMQLRGKDMLETIENICLWSHNNLKYIGTSSAEIDQDVQRSGGGSVACLKRGGGHCEGQASVTIALLRSIGVPARFVRGNAGFMTTSGTPAYHTWVEYYVPSFGWLQWDINNPPFTVPTRYCVGLFRYDSPYSAPGNGDPAMRDLWFFAGLMFPNGLDTVGVQGNAAYTRIKMEL